ncbi:hypothetical protein NDU88_009473 [Pleurodeles waltl]|uniref:Uncharacterized protein n=1 Tax=Pleurodeles waltl TaxID=8319 RepID=A0AAV7RVC0_PLEWA|nr:hypothetical protein NDU88_009473 [Pleurodeles waltl]
MTPRTLLPLRRGTAAPPCQIGGLFGPNFASRWTGAGWAPKWRKTAEAALQASGVRRAAVTARRGSTAEPGTGAGDLCGRGQPPRPAADLARGAGGDGFCPTPHTPFCPPPSWSPGRGPDLGSRPAGPGLRRGSLAPPPLRTDAAGEPRAELRGPWRKGLERILRAWSWSRDGTGPAAHRGTGVPPPRRGADSETFADLAGGVRSQEPFVRSAHPHRVLRWGSVRAACWWVAPAHCLELLWGQGPLTWDRQMGVVPPPPPQHAGET